MNIEVEIKLKINNIGEIKKILPKFGKFVKSIKQVDEYYIPCHRNFFANKPHPVEWLRIRNNPDKTIFEYDKSINKKADGEQECANEYETEISRPEEFRKILGFLDFRKVITVKKQREYWDCGNFEVVLDKVEEIGDFMEAEAKGNFENTIKAKKGCVNFLKKLGMKNCEKEQIKVGYPVLILEKRKQIKKRRDCRRSKAKKDIVDS